MAKYNFGVPSGSAEYSRLWKAANKEKVAIARKRDYAKFRADAEKRGLHNSRNLTNYLRLRASVLDLLGRKCVKCGYDSDERALQIDHINSDGSRHRACRSTRQQLNDILNDLDYAQKYQVLCANCNWLKRYENNELFRDKGSANESRINSRNE